ncbi:hypothetical protein [Herbaspirillum frisingense]|uniref:hypothetical protein n=1 Tax=Herbaspirillum frisingense TaxID=92645 RepID=UPI001F45B87C|nr:hypothetical protein [Herbaspirillum frisingense]UIN21433.1 hypothetical protein LAZ82_23825 [Herbaspirillum frisingense]
MQQSFEFDIPALPLVDALDRYTILTGRPTLYPSALVAGRTGSPVAGSYSAGTALRLMLQGTGLAVKEIQEGATQAYVLLSATTDDGLDDDEAIAAARRTPAPATAIVDEYDALVQRRAWDTLCSSRQTAPGSYRALLRFGIDTQGRLVRPRLLGSTGNTRLDSELPAALEHLEIGQAPPAGLAQPFTMLILPQGQLAGRACPAGAH